MSGYTLGIDLGTSNLKVVALDERGDVVAGAVSHHGIEPGVPGVQADPLVWWESLRAALSDLLPQLVPDRIRGIGFSGNMSSVVLVDAAGAAVAPALLLADSRGEEELATLDPALAAKIVTSTGNVPESVFSLSSLLWWSAQHRSVLESAHAWLSAKDYLRARLTGVIATDITDAYNSLLIDGGEWNLALVRELGLPRHLFPPLRDSAAIAGVVTEEAAAATGLPPGVPVAAGSGDMAAAIAGLGGLDAGTVMISLGTSAILMATLADSRRLPDRARGALTEHPASDGGRFALGSLLTGGLALNWLRSLVGADAISRAADVPDPQSPLFFLPYLTGTGSPDFVAAARGTVWGISPSTTPEQIAAALMEAIAFDVNDLLDILGRGGYDHVVLSGGGSNLPQWRSVLADVLQLPVDTVDAADLSAIGAAGFAWSALGTPVDVAWRRTRTAPDPRRAAAWATRRRGYARAREWALRYYTSTTDTEMASDT